MARTSLTRRNIRRAGNLYTKLAEVDDALDALMGDSSAAAATAEVVTAAGAVSVAVPHTDLSVTDTVAYTIASGTKIGQEKTIRCTVAGGSPAGTITGVYSNGG